VSDNPLRPMFPGVRRREERVQRARQAQDLRHQHTQELKTHDPSHTGHREPATRRQKHYLVRYMRYRHSALRDMSKGEAGRLIREHREARNTTAPPRS